MSRAVRIPALAVLVLLASSCGIGGEKQAFRPIEPGDAQAALGEPPTTTTSTTAAPTTTTTIRPAATTTPPTTTPPTTLPPTTTVPPTTVPEVPEVLWFVRGAQLAKVERATTGLLTLRRVLADLAAGPVGGETAGGVIRSVINPTMVAVGDITIAGGVATVDLAPPFRDLADNEAQLAIAQLVYTLTLQTSVPGVGQVRFTLSGKQLSVPRGNGTQTNDPVSTDDYPDVIGT